MIVELFLTFVALIVYIYWKLTENHRYWADRGVVHRPPLLFYGNIKDRLANRVSYHEFNSKYYLDFKGHRCVGINEGTAPVLMVRDPELIRDILVKDFNHFVDKLSMSFKMPPYLKNMLFITNGDEWRKLRATLTPTFSSGQIKRMFSTVEDCAINMMNHLNESLENSADGTLEGVDTKDLYGKAALDVIASTAFGVQSSSFKNENAELSQRVAAFNDLPISQKIILIGLMLFNPPNWIKSRLTLSFFNNDTLNFLADVYKETADYRLKNNMRRNDFLQLLLDAQNGLMTDISNNSSDHDKAVITEEVAIAQAALFFLAGYDTTSILLSMTNYCLAQNMDVQDKVREEIIKVLGDDQILTYEKIKEMTYLDLVLSETLRIYPPLARLDRVCTKPYKLDNINLSVGDRLFIPCAGIHMDPLYYPEPEKFVPERFLPEENAKRHPYVYMPFGLGPRMCIGMRFAQMSTKIILTHVLKDYVIELDKETPIPFLYDEFSSTAKPKGGQLKLKLRAIHING